MTVDGMFTRLDAPTVGYHQSYYVEDSILDEDSGTHRWSDVSIRDHWVNGHDDRRAGAGSLHDHRAPRRRHDAVRLEWRVADDGSLEIHVRRLPLQGRSRFRRQEHLDRLRHRRQSHRPRGHEQPACPISASRSKTGAISPTALQNGELGNDGLWTALHRPVGHGCDRQGHRPVASAASSSSTWARSGHCSSARPAPSAPRCATPSRTIPMAARASTAIMYDVTFASLGADVVRHAVAAEFHAQCRRQLSAALHVLRRRAAI